jgi:hypothetical protein
MASCSPLICREAFWRGALLVRAGRKKVIPQQIHAHKEQRSADIDRQVATAQRENAPHEVRTLKQVCAALSTQVSGTGARFVMKHDLLIGRSDRLLRVHQRLTENAMLLVAPSFSGNGSSVACEDVG